MQRGGPAESPVAANKRNLFALPPSTFRHRQAAAANCTAVANGSILVASARDENEPRERSEIRGGQVESFRLTNALFGLLPKRFAFLFFKRIFVVRATLECLGAAQHYSELARPSNMHA